MFEKVGLHIIEGYNQPLGRAPVVTVYNPSDDYLREIRAECGEECLIVRRYPEEERWPGEVPVGNTVVQRVNEPTLRSVADAERFLEQELAFLQEIHGLGQNAALCVPSVGNFELDIWETLSPLELEMQKGDVVAVHEYWSSAKLDQHIPWHCGRFTLPKWTMNVPVVVTEIGRDVIRDTSLPPSEWGAPGWKVSGITATEYLDEIENYNRRVLMPYDNVIGGTVFTVGNDDRWRNYDVAEVYQVIRHERDSSAPPPPPPPPPPEKPSCEDVRDMIRAWAEDLESIAAQMRHVADRICQK